jgi:hypothetical protein
MRREIPSPDAFPSSELVQHRLWGQFGQEAGLRGLRGNPNQSGTPHYRGERASRSPDGPKMTPTGVPDVNYSPISCIFTAFFIAPWLRMLHLVPSRHPLHRPGSTP